MPGGLEQAGQKFRRVRVREGQTRASSWIHDAATIRLETYIYIYI